MGDQTHAIILEAIRAGQFGRPASPEVEAAVANGGGDFAIDRLKFDSLAWMEFCISVELQSGQDLAPSDIAAMQYLNQIEDWLRTRMGR
jgi:hypothetical protein